MKPTRIAVLPLYLLIAVSLAVHAAPITIITENFNSLAPNETLTSAGIFHTIDGTNIDIVGMPSSNPNGVGDYAGICMAPESGNCLDLDGTGGASQGVIQTSFFLTPGVYDLSFDIAGAGGPSYAQYGRNITTSATATISGGLYSQTFTLSPTAVDVVSTDITVTHPGTYSLTFASDTPGNIGSLLDNVSITSVVDCDPPADPPAGVPEPSSLAMLSIGGALIVPAAMRKLRARA
jgi:hypothetical protein